MGSRYVVRGHEASSWVDRDPRHEPWHRDHLQLVGVESGHMACLHSPKTDAILINHPCNHYHQQPLSVVLINQPSEIQIFSGRSGSRQTAPKGNHQQQHQSGALINHRLPSLIIL